MAETQPGELRYAILDPTGNTTALVETSVEVGRQPEVATWIMGQHPQVEQVGFVRLGVQDADVQAELRMAGGEFCGNATMCAAALQALVAGAHATDETSLMMRVSGASRPVEVRLSSMGDTAFAAEVLMPPALGIDKQAFEVEGHVAHLPLVRMEGISHVVIEQSSACFGLRDDRVSAERAVRSWCTGLEADGLGLMFLEASESSYTMTPLVYVPASCTVFWESSCASGSSAVAKYLAWETGAAVDVTLQEPGGTIGVSSDPSSGETWLRGKVQLVARYAVQSRIL